MLHFVLNCSDGRACCNFWDFILQNNNRKLCLEFFAEMSEAQIAATSVAFSVLEGNINF
jgi:hypothetical protein